MVPKLDVPSLLGHLNLFAQLDEKNLARLAERSQQVRVPRHAFVIEGRQRSPAYVAQVVSTLRAALDAAERDPARFSVRPDWQAALARHAEGAQTTQGAFDRPWK